MALKQIMTVKNKETTSKMSADQTLWSLIIGTQAIQTHNTYPVVGSVPLM
jgi:hypothetical protein